MSRDRDERNPLGDSGSSAGRGQPLSVNAVVHRAGAIGSEAYAEGLFEMPDDEPRPASLIIPIDIGAMRWRVCVRSSVASIRFTFVFHPSLILGCIIIGRLLGQPAKAKPSDSARSCGRADGAALRPAGRVAGGGGGIDEQARRRGLEQQHVLRFLGSLCASTSARCRKIGLGRWWHDRCLLLVDRIRVGKECHHRAQAPSNIDRASPSFR